jgi:hypothetical protein
MCNFEVVVRCDTLLSYANGIRVTPTAAVVGGDVNAKEGNDVLWDAWGPQATSVTALDSRMAPAESSKVVRYGVENGLKKT